MELSERQLLSLFIISKVISSLSLSLFIFLIYKHCSSSTSDRTLIFPIKCELIASCMIYQIGYIIPVRDCFSNQAEVILCNLQIFVLTFSNFSTILFSVAIPFITYKILLDSHFIETHPGKAHLIVSLISWGIPAILALIFKLCSGNEYDGYIGWYSNRIVQNIVTGINFGVLIIFGILLLKLKKQIEKFLQGVSEDFDSKNYRRSFNNFNILVVFATFCIILEIIIKFVIIPWSNEVYFIFLIINCILECSYYLVNASIFCLHRHMIPCCTKEEINNRITRPTTIPLINSKTEEENDYV